GARRRRAAPPAESPGRPHAEAPPAPARGTPPGGAPAELELVRFLEHRRWLTARSVDRIIRTARTIADLDERDEILPDDIREASQFRGLENEPLVDPRMLLARPEGQAAC